MNTKTKQSIQKLIVKIEKNLQEINLILNSRSKNSTSKKIQEEAKNLIETDEDSEVSDTDNEKIIKGIFDGQNMAGTDNQVYPIPPNYASKSKLVEGDLLKLTIKEDGSFLYKQIKPLERKKTIGTLAQDEKENYIVLAEGKAYKVLTASITYFKGEIGDEVTIILPKDKESDWGAVESIIKVPKTEMSLNDLKNISDNTNTDSEEDNQDMPELLLPREAMPEIEPEEEKEKLPPQDTEPQLEEGKKEEYEEIEEI